MPKLLETTRAAPQGYYGTTMEELATETGIAKGAAYA